MIYHQENGMLEGWGKLETNDLKLLSNSQEMFEHIRKVYDFSTSTEPLEEWWWHLDKLLKGEIVLNAVPVQGEVI